MSASMVFGFFALANGDRVKTFRTGSSVATYHCVYETTTQCTSGVIFPVMLCVYSPFNDIALPDNTVVFVSMKMSIPAGVPWDPILLEGISVIAIPGDPSLDNYEHSVPDFPYPMVVSLGSVTAPMQTLADGTSKAFDVLSSDYVHNTRMTSNVWCILNLFCVHDCVFNSAHPCWAKTPVLNQNSVVFYIGCFSDAASTGGLQVDLKSIALNVGVVELKTSVGTSPSSVSKKHKFMAMAPKGGDYVGMLSEVGRGDKVPSASAVAPSASDALELASSMMATHQSPQSQSRSVTPTDNSPPKSTTAMSASRGRGKAKWV
ncbi:hypothetical protein EDC04DRAFT_2606343 [Pisolithus marmoratus]|nr:hypothetical protein EDC04DRAFT_2606343 [Pisolithus marmoratus]